MKKLMTILFGVVLITLFAGTVYYLYAKSQKPPVVYETAAPAMASIVNKTVATGSVVPRKEVEIKPQVSGIVEQLLVEPGATVKAGDLLARITIIPDMVTLRSAESRVKLSRIKVDNAKRDLERNTKLRAEGAISEAGLQRFVQTHDQSQEELAAALDNLQLIKKGAVSSTGKTSNTRVRATVAGMVLEVPVEVGSSVIESNTFNDGTTIATIADMDDLIFKGKVDESEVGKIRPGMELLVTIGAMEDVRFEAKLEHIAPKGVEENGAVQFEIRAALELEPGVFVRANLSANADVVLARRDDVLTINESLLQFDGDTVFVEVETAPQQFEKRTIETGLSDGIIIEVLAGLSEEDRVKNASKKASSS